MDQNQRLAEQFEEQRPRLRSVAYRILGSSNEADDAVQEAWLHLSRSGPDEIGNLAGWLTTVVARICLSMLRSRKVPREEPLEAGVAAREEHDPEEEALLTDSVGLALQVVLDTLSPDSCCMTCSACHAVSVSRQPNHGKATTQKAASPPIMVTNSSSRLDVGRPRSPGRLLASLGYSRRADGGENGVVLA